MFMNMFFRKSLILLLLVTIETASANHATGKDPFGDNTARDNSEEEEDDGEDLRYMTEEERLRDTARKSGMDPDSAIYLTPAKLDDEEQGSPFMPKAYRCDGCEAIAYKLDKKFKASEKYVKRGSRLPIGDIIDSVESVCNDPFENYGLKNVNGQKYLTGEGMESFEYSGMITTGSNWPKRFQNLCKELLEDFEEEDIYHLYRKSKSIKLKQSLCVRYCKDKQKEEEADDDDDEEEEDEDDDEDYDEEVEYEEEEEEDDEHDEL